MVGCLFTWVQTSTLRIHARTTRHLNSWIDSATIRKLQAYRYRRQSQTTSRLAVIILLRPVCSCGICEGRLQLLSRRRNHHFLMPSQLEVGGVRQRCLSTRHRLWIIRLPEFRKSAGQHNINTRSHTLCHSTSDISSTHAFPDRRPFR